MKRRILVIVIIIAIILLLIVAKLFTTKRQHPINHSSVEVTQPKMRAEALFFKIPGSVDASKSVTIRSKVTGLIKQIAFEQGQMVNAGQLLFQIDPASFTADLQQAQAELLKDQAQSAVLKADKSRYLDLYQKGFSSKQRYEQAIADFNSNLAEIKADRAIINQKRIALADTRITAPIHGKTGNVIVKTGDLVNANDTTLVVINQLSPIFVNFYLTPDQLSQLMPFYRHNKIHSEIYSEDGNHLLSKGVVTFIDNTIDPTSGTVLLKATIANSDQRLWPGQSVIVKVILTIEQNDLVIPARAVRTDQQGDFVYLVKQGKVSVQHIHVARQVADRAIIAKGLSVNDTIATVFPPGLKDGAKVTVVTTTEK